MDTQFKQTYLLFKNKPQDLIDFAWQQFKMGRTEATVTDRIHTLNRFLKHTNLNNPDEVFKKLATLTWKNSTKTTFLDTYGAYLKFKGIPYTRPTYEPQDSIPFIPTETEINQLIAGATRTMATYLQLLKETGIRCSESLKLQWMHFDLERKTVRITPAKGGNPRILPISHKLITMLNQLPHRNKEYLFSRRRNNITTKYDILRKRIAENTGNPRILQIHFHAFRHYYGTMEYHKTHDVKHVQYCLGHKHSDSTDVYINIEQATFLTDQSDQQWTTRISHNIQEETTLIEAGFELVRAINETTAIYRKRK